MQRLMIILGVCAVCIAADKPPAIAVPTSEPGTTRPPVQETIPAAELQDLFRTELGNAYDPVQANQLTAAHGLLEQYFAAHTSADRKSLLAQLQATQIDPNVLGLLCRIREHWPALTGGGVFYLNQKIGPNNVRYFLGIPKSYSRDKAWPLVIKLPGATAFLTKPPPDAKRVVEIYTGWIQDELSKHGDAIVLMPLLNLDELYGPSYTGMNSVIQPLLDAAEHANIDPARVYMVGHSMAAHATWNLALHYPTYFAAINPLAGAASEEWQRLRLMNLLNVRPIVWHDDSDNVIKVNFSRSLVKELENLKIPVDFDETKGIGHAPTDEIVQAEYQKMRAAVRDLYPRRVWLQTNRPDVLLNRNDWVQIYQELDTGKAYPLFFRHGTGHMLIYANSCSIKAEISSNHIDVSADNVDAMRFYLNDQMANLAEKITVTVNGKEKFREIVKPSVEEMLKDQLFLGRGWRYYTGVVDILMVPPATQPATKPAPARKGKITVGPTPDQ